MSIYSIYTFLSHLWWPILDIHLSNVNSETVGIDSFNTENFAKAHYTSALTGKVSVNL